MIALYIILGILIGLIVGAGGMFAVIFAVAMKQKRDRDENKRD